MVIGYLRIIKHFLRLYEWLSFEQCSPGFIRFQTFQNVCTLRINVITQESGIHTRISGNLLFVQRLDETQGFVGRITELLVAFYLQGSQIEQTQRRLFSFFLAYRKNGKGHFFNTVEQSLPLFFAGNRLDSGIIFLSLS